MELLECPIQPYAWGSRTVIARLQGRPVPSAGPEAELWVGAHPAAPSRAAGVPLSERIADDPTGVLGAAAVTRFGPRLPYLLKLLAAAEPLSLQAHPDPRQAAAGYAAEEDAGVPREAAHRRYVDRYHKPELLVAVTRFRALCGFREPAATAGLLDGLGLRMLTPVIAALRRDDLAAATRWLLNHGEPGRLVAEVARAADAAGDDPLGPYGVVRDLAARYPGDVGVVVTLLLNLVTLAPGEAIFMPAGNLHTYLEGTGVEAMAASDNVLRGGLTSKPVDVAELLRMLRFEPLTDPVLTPVAENEYSTRDGSEPAVVTWPVPVPDFALHRVRPPAGVPAVALPVAGPAVVLCLAGRPRVDDGVMPVTLGAGDAAFRPGGSAATLSFAGEADLYVASLGKT